MHLHGGSIIVILFGAPFFSMILIYAHPVSVTELEWSMHLYIQCIYYLSTQTLHSYGEGILQTLKRLLLMRNYQLF